MANGISTGLDRLSNKRIGELAQDVLAPFYAKPSRAQMLAELDRFQPDLDRHERLVIVQRAERLADDKERFHPLPDRPAPSQPPKPEPPKPARFGPQLKNAQRDELRAATLKLLRDNPDTACTEAHRRLGEPLGIGYNGYYCTYFRPARNQVQSEPHPAPPEPLEPLDPWAVLQRIANRKQGYRDGGAAFRWCQEEAQDALRRRAEGEPTRHDVVISQTRCGGCGRGECPGASGGRCRELDL